MGERRGKGKEWEGKEEGSLFLRDGDGNGRERVNEGKKRRKGRRSTRKEGEEPALPMKNSFPRACSLRSTASSDVRVGAVIEQDSIHRCRWKRSQFIQDRIFQGGSRKLREGKRSLPSPPRPSLPLPFPLSFPFPPH